MPQNPLRDLEPALQVLAENAYVVPATGQAMAALPRSAPFTAATGATLRELMDRMGHSSTRAALIYLHGNDDRQRAIADGLSKLAQPELRRQEPGSPRQARGKRSGTRRARKAGNG